MNVIEKNRNNWISVLLIGTMVLVLFAGLYIWYRQLPEKESVEYDGIFVWVGNEECL